MVAEIWALVISPFVDQWVALTSCFLRTSAVHPMSMLVMKQYDAGYEPIITVVPQKAIHDHLNFATRRALH